MNYPGNPALSADAQQRLLGTFDQTLDLAENGSRQEALLGCDFVLRMDPQFEPARKLQERLRSSAGAVPVADLKAPANGSPAAGPADLHDLSHLPAELPELDDLDAELVDLSPELPDLTDLTDLDTDPAQPLRAHFAELLAAR